MEYRFEYRNGHVEVYDRRNIFVFSADTEQEAWQECLAIYNEEAERWN